MGSCVSQCSRQDVIHQQSNRIKDCTKTSIEIREGISFDDKDFEAQLSEIIKDYTSELKAEDINSTKDRDGRPTPEQFKYEMRALREQLMRSQVLFTYLLRDTQNMKSPKSADNQYRHDELIEGARFRNLSNISSGSYASHRSTPMHTSFNSLSCPQLPSATQAEYLNTGPRNSDSSKHGPSENICEIHEEPEGESSKNLLRNRTDSFLAAVNNGNPKMVETADVAEQQKGESHHGSFVSDNGSKMISTDKIECVFPRKLSILIEEEHEDASGSHFSTSHSQPFVNRKKKILPPCNAKTQTDLTLVPNEPPSMHRHFPFDKRTSPEKSAFREIYQPRHGYSIVAQAVQKRTVYSEELPKKLVTRYPPPYTNKLFKLNAYMSSDHIYFKELASRPKTHMYKWATVAESLPSKSESFQYLTHKSGNDPNLQTRHLSLEKQESYSSSCDPSIYPESQMSSVTDCSGWMTKSEVDINVHPEPPSYMQSMLSARWHQTRRYRQESVPVKPISEKTAHKIALETRSKDEKSKSIDIPVSNSDENKDKKRCMRRGSAGSSELSIPRYPAFDFSEQEDVQSLLQSPAEPSKDEGAKAKSAQAVHEAEATAIRDQVQKLSGLHKKESTTTKKKETTKTKTLMPELMENSETESAKGSFECEVPYAPPTTEQVPTPNTAEPNQSSPIPNLSNMSVLSDTSILPSMPFDDKQIEATVASLALRFKTDVETLQTREERQKLKRDVAEENIEAEIEIMKNLLQKLNSQATTERTRDMILSLQKHVDVIQKVTSSVSRESETYGAVQQEVRTSGIIKMLLQYVTHLKQVCDSERNKLEKTRRLLSDNKIDGAPEEHKKSLKTIGITVQSIKSVGRRRASVATFHQHSLPESSKIPGFSQSWSSGYSILKEVKTQCSAQGLITNISSVGMSSSSLATSPSFTSQPHSSNNNPEAICPLSICDTNLMVQSLPNSLEATVQDFASSFLQSQNDDRKNPNVWRRKLSLVADVKENSDEENDDEAFQENQLREDWRLNSPRLSLENNNYAFLKTSSSNESLNESSGSSTEPEPTTKFEKKYINRIQVVKEILEKWLHIPEIILLLQQNSYGTIFRYTCSLLMAFVALYCFIVIIILPSFSETEEVKITSSVDKI